jgi:streptomycin 6-kinase
MLRLQTKATDWNVTLDDIQETPTSLLGFGTRFGASVVIKIVKKAGDESRSGEVLKAYAGDGAVRVYAYEKDAVLLERIQPGEQLVTLVTQGQDEEATQILAEVIGRLANHEAPPGLPTVADWGRGFDRYLEGDAEEIPRNVVAEARGLYQELAATQRHTMLLHGDLQHYNVLFDRDRGWLAIDPKGVVGELEYELGALLRNPVELPHVLSDPVIIGRRLETLTALLNLDESRALRWSYCQAILSAIWSIEDNQPIRPDNAGLLLAHSLKQMMM